VDVERVRPNGKPPEDFYLLVGGFVPYKREEIVLEAFRSLPRRLVVVGDGPGRATLAARAPANVEFTGRIGDVEVADLYARCRALLYPQEEDFGIVAVEAQAAGRPVLAYGRGGASETVVPLRAGESATEPAAPTGLFFHEQSPQAVVDAVARFEREEARFDAAAIRSHAEAFAAPRFRREILREIELGLEQKTTRRDA
jgi:glycosyltransferase involved in cell wall biosynthesis